MLQLNYNLLTCTLGLVQTARLVHDLDAEAREATGLEPPGRWLPAVLGRLLFALASCTLPPVSSAELRRCARMATGSVTYTCNGIIPDGELAAAWRKCVSRPVAASAGDDA